MNYAGTFAFANVGDTQTDATGGDGPVGSVLSSATASTIIVHDANLLFSGDYKRAGVDLVLSKDGHDYIVSDYFKGPQRAALSSPDGATLSAGLVKALVGEVQVAQLGGGASVAAQEIGTVTKLTGNATAIRNGVSVMLNVGDKVQKGDMVQTGTDSVLGLTFIDGTVFGLSSNARMMLNEMVYDPNGSSNSSLLSLVQGTITFVAGETAKHGDMRVDTPVATMGIRGTAVLVEIGFEVPGQGDAPPVKFQVLVEPGGQIGSYLLYSKSNPSVVIGTVNQAGLVTSVTGAGDTSTGQAPPLSPDAIAILGPVFQLYFGLPSPNQNLHGSPPGGSSPTDPNSGTSPQPLKFNPFQDLLPGGSITVPINNPNGSPGTIPPVDVTITHINTAPVITIAKLDISQGGTVVLGTSNVGASDTDSTNFTFKVSNVSHGTFQVSTDGIHWTDTTTFTSADLSAGHVRFVHDGSQAAPTFSLQADDGAASSNLSSIVPGIIGFSLVNAPPVITHASITVAEGGTAILTAANIGVSDIDSTSFTFTISHVTHGVFQVSSDGIHWIDATTFTSADLYAGHVRFVHDGGGVAPDVMLTVSDGIDSSAPFAAHVDFLAICHLTSTAGTTIDISPFGATDGFVLPGAGNVTTPGIPEDRIVLGYDIGGHHVVLNGAPMMGDKDFSAISNTLTHNADGSNSVSTVLGAGNGVILTQTITLGADANFFTTTIDIFNGGTTALDHVRFMRNFDPDQDVDQYGTHQTRNEVIHNPIGANDVAIVSAKGGASGADVALIGLSGDWRASSFGFTNTNPYAPEAYDSPNNPNGALADNAISLTYNFGSIAAGQHATVTYITTNNVATNGNNALYGTDGNDTINGFSGDDLLIGLGGADNFVFTANAGHDTIFDFQTHVDHIDLSAVVSTNDVTAWIAQHVTASPLNGADTLITLDAHNTILLHNVTHTNLSASDFIVHSTST